MGDYDTVYAQLMKMLPLEDFNHACTVAGKCKHLKRTCVVAFIHDVVEDGYATFEEVQQRFNLNDEQMAALDAITRRQGEKYFDYIARVKQNEMATTVKLADLQHNITRCINDLPNRWGLIRRYAKAYGILIDKWRDKNNE